MFDIQVQLLVARRPVTFNGFVDSILAEIVRRVGAEMQNLSQVRLAEIALPAREENRKGIRPLAVSVDDAAKMLGVSSCTLRRRVADGEIRTIRLGRRVLVPMDVMERVMAAGMDEERT
jgi:excisionase family DNA binding protein